MCIAVDCGVPTRLYRNVTPEKKRNMLLPIFSFGQPKLQIGNLPNLKIDKKKKIGNQFLVFWPFPGYKFQNLDSIGIHESQLMEAF